MPRPIPILALLMALTHTPYARAQTASTTHPAFAMHGGAGKILKQNIKPEVEAAIRADLEQALTTGYAILQRGGTALDAIEAAIRVLEDSPRFNAGKGAVMTAQGTFELDASIMDGQTLAAGAVAGLMHIKNPISLARLVMTKSPHVMLIGSGAEAFALSQGIDTVPNEYFATDVRHQQYEKWRDSVAGKPTQQSSADPANAWADHKYGTVGAVALDRQGNLAAGTSTGGTPFKRWGRVGDSPIIGAGTYASNKAGCAVSGTGVGEYFIRNTVAADICKRVEYLHESIDKAAKHVINDVLVPQGGDGGVVVMDKKGHSVHVFNTDGMFRGYIDANGKPVVELYK
jgi:beta-aspartyl-peptidase (threonine type)